MAHKYDETTKREDVFIEAMVQGRKPVEAARIAQYSDPNGEPDRLLARARVRDRLIDLLQRKAVSYELLRVKMLKRLDMMLDNEHQEGCSIEEEPPEGSQRICSCGLSKIKPSDVMSAIKAVIELLGKSDPKLLKDRAQQADKAETFDEAASRIVGDDDLLPIPGEPVN